MIKLLHYNGEDESGVHSRLITPGEPDLIKTASPLHDEVQQFIARLKPREDKTYALVNALGATEIWGPNINADGFSIDALKHEPPGWRNIPPWDVEARRALAATAPYGYTTFYGANAFRHHKNKPYAPYNHPVYGNVVLAVWHDRMKRVELVQELDHGLCQAGGGWEIIEKLRAGEFLPVSMGCRVKYDVCSICGHRAKTRKDYCEHMNRLDPRFRPNMILPDGRIIFVWNPHPRFFDISYVLIGADKTAKVMALLSSGKKMFIFVRPDSLAEPSADRAEELGYTEASLQKTASALSPEEELLSMLQEPPKTAAQKTADEKIADIIKELPPDLAAGRAVPLLERAEPDLPAGVLNQMAQPRSTVSADLGDILGTVARMGIVLKPHEFQRIILVRSGEPRLADRYDTRGEVFAPNTEMGACPSLGVPVDAFQQLLRPFVSTRCMFGPVLRKRIIITISAEPPMGDAPRAEVRNPLLDEISGAYNSYRRGLLSAMSDSLSDTSAGELDPISQLFSRKAVATDATPLAGLSSAGPIVYLIRAHWGAGKKLGPEVDRRIVQNNPRLVAKLAFAQPA